MRHVAGFQPPGRAVSAIMLRMVFSVPRVSPQRCSAACPGLSADRVGQERVSILFWRSAVPRGWFVSRCAIVSPLACSSAPRSGSPWRRGSSVRSECREDSEPELASRRRWIAPSPTRTVPRGTAVAVGMAGAVGSPRGCPWVIRVSSLLASGRAWRGVYHRLDAARDRVGWRACPRLPSTPPGICRAWCASPVFGSLSIRSFNLEELLQGRAPSAICRLIGRLIDLWSRLIGLSGAKWTPEAPRGSIAGPQAA